MIYRGPGRLHRRYPHHMFCTCSMPNFVNFCSHCNNITVHHLGMCFIIEICFLLWNESWGRLGRLLFAIATGLGMGDLRSSRRKCRELCLLFHFVP